jgi:hypothetical protein
MRSFVFAAVELPASSITRTVPVRVIRNYYRQFLPRFLRTRRVKEETSYVFAFLGEFGYELFNWQGVVRKFAQQIPPSSDIIVAGRKDLEAFYEEASRYIDISDFELYRESVAAGYFALPPDILRRHFPPSPRELAFDDELRSALILYLRQRIARPGRRLEFIFSSQMTAYPGCLFGVDRHYYGRRGHPGRIYGSPDFLKYNLFRRIEPDLRVKTVIEEKLGFELERPYVLVQTRRRQIGPQVGRDIPEHLLIEEVSRHIPTVVLSFNTGRLMDSSSELNNEAGRAVSYPVGSFREQGCLIAHAKKCLFLSEGDLGSHTYLPPFMGRDVVVVASKEIFKLSSAPVEFWNKHVFTFGGQMIPWEAESLFESLQNLRAAVAGLITR